MSAYSELIKNFEKIRAYMREFYVYGFKSREEYDKKSLRSYDDVRRRIESWLGGHMRFIRTAEGKNIFISIDSRTPEHNPLFKAWKAKSFTDGDITLHFILFDILDSPEKALTLPQITEIMDGEYLSYFDSPRIFDESTVRKKLREYVSEGIIVSEKDGKKTLFRRADATPVPENTEFLDFASEALPCGVIGSFLLDKLPERENIFTFKHHSITDALDSDVMAMLFSAMRKKSAVTLINLGRNGDKSSENFVIPLKIFIGSQNGRSHLMAYKPKSDAFCTFRLDRISDIKVQEPFQRFDELRERLESAKDKTWGVTGFGASKKAIQKTEYVEFTVRIDDGEEHIIKRLEREKRCGKVEMLDSHTYKFSADVYDTNEMAPWIRTFICRIVQMNFSNRTVENRIKNDILKLYEAYGIGGEET